MRTARTAIAGVLASTLAAALAAPSASAAGDPVMPLSEVRSGMRCEARSVVRGVTIERFNAEVVEVVDDSAGIGARILLEVSGPVVDGTGIGPGFSGSPVYCPAADGTSKVAGAISEGIGEYGGRVVLATPIEDILGETPDPPAEARPMAPKLSRQVRALAAPLSVTGLSPSLGRALSAVARRSGRTVLAAPVSPKTRYAPQQLAPGSAFSVGYSSGDVALGAIGTVTYVDGANVWGFGHPFETAGRRSLLLQDAYVYRVIGNPNAGGDTGGTYKLAAPGHDLGTLTNDALSAVVGKLGALPATIPVTVRLEDLDTKARKVLNVRVADEADLGQPVGASGVGFIAPLVLTQGTTMLMRSSPIRTSGRMCMRIRLEERPKGPIRVCNRYVGVGAGGGEFFGGNAVAAAMATDMLDALLTIDAFRFGDLHVRGVAADVEMERGARQVFMRKLVLPRSVRPGQRVTARLTVQPLRSSARSTIRFPMTIPDGIRSGRRTIRLTGTDSDSGEGDFFDDLSAIFEIDDFEDEDIPATEDEGLPNVAAVVRAVERIRRYDGVVARFPGDKPNRREIERRVGRLPHRGRPVHRSELFRISGQAKAVVRVRRGG